MVPRPRVRGGAEGRAGQGSRAKPIPGVLASPMTEIQRRNFASSACAGSWKHSSRLRAAMSPARAEALVKLTMRGLALSFAVVGILFIATPDGVLHRIDQLGDLLGSFSHAPRTEEKLWLALGVAYMTVITGLAFVVSLDPARYRPLLLVLAAGKAASSLAAGAFYLGHDVFTYLLNFAVDGGPVRRGPRRWALHRRIEARAPG